MDLLIHKQPNTQISFLVGYGLGHEDLPDNSHGVNGYSPYVASDSSQPWDIDGHGHGMKAF